MVSASVRRRDDGKTEIVTRLSIRVRASLSRSGAKFGMMDCLKMDSSMGGDVTDGGDGAGTSEGLLGSSLPISNPSPSAACLFPSSVPCNPAVFFEITTAPAMMAPRSTASMIPIGHRNFLINRLKELFCCDCSGRRLLGGYGRLTCSSENSEGQAPVCDMALSPLRGDPSMSPRLVCASEAPASLLLDAKGVNAEAVRGSISKVLLKVLDRLVAAPLLSPSAISEPAKALDFWDLIEASSGIVSSSKWWRYSRWRRNCSFCCCCALCSRSRLPPIFLELLLMVPGTVPRTSVVMPWHRRQAPLLRRCALHPSRFLLCPERWIALLFALTWACLSTSILTLISASTSRCPCLSPWSWSSLPLLNRHI